MKKYKQPYGGTVPMLVHKVLPNDITLVLKKTHTNKNNTAFPKTLSV